MEKKDNAFQCVKDFRLAIYGFCLNLYNHIVPIVPIFQSFDAILRFPQDFQTVGTL